MKTGLLWFDDNPRMPLASKIDNAVRRYREKFGRAPTVCYVHPQSLVGTPVLPMHVRVVGLASVLPNHFWIGVNQPEAQSAVKCRANKTSQVHGGVSKR